MHLNEKENVNPFIYFFGKKLFLNASGIIFIKSIHKVSCTQK